jgi:hypothetical protein
MEYTIVNSLVFMGGVMSVLLACLIFFGGMINGNGDLLFSNQLLDPCFALAYLGALDGRPLLSYNVLCCIGVSRLMRPSRAETA